ncbi:histidine kinase dimerization/phosphoacceptor domain-containing protein, partial [Paenibacillus sepulcri]|nr:histidine kinase dimerization/phosphoacceptor domain-containing protein [Paenibacillus sepulcri]
MELWTVGNKTILLLYVIAASYFAVSEPISWLVLYYLIYLAMNLVVHIVKDPRVKQGIIGGIILYLIGCAAYVHPYFILLLPLSAYELSSFRIQNQVYVLMLVLLPMLFMRNSMLALYGFTAVLSFFNYVMIRKYMARVNKQEDSLERMRGDLHRLSKKQNENRDFLRTTEYTAKLEERSRLSQEIHDGIGHAMTGALI